MKTIRLFSFFSLLFLFLLCSTSGHAQTLTASITSHIDNICSGQCNGALTAAGSGGSGTYTYSWSPGGSNTASISSLCAGTYTVTVMDALGHTATTSATITEPTAISGTPTTTSSACGRSNGTAIISVTGGTGAYSYSWTPGVGAGQGTASVSGLSPGSYTVFIIDANNCQYINTISITNTPGPTATPVSSTNVSCFGASNGTATITASGGTGALTYSWSPSGGSGPTATGLSAGNYTATVSDANGCDAVVTSTITQPAQLTANASQTNVSCNGGANGSATVNPTGGTSSYTYSWTPSGGVAGTATGLSAGTYTATITDAHGCTTMSVSTITQPQPLTCNSSGINSTCGYSNGELVAIPAGGTATYTYSWTPIGANTPSVTGVPTGTYTVTITDANGCSISSVAVVQNTPGPSSSVSGTGATCYGVSDGTATDVGTGGTLPYTYTWAPTPPGGQGTPTASGLTAGSYTVTIADANGCVSTHTVTIVQPTILSIVTTSSTSESCASCCDASASITAGGGTPAYTYSWSSSPVQTTATATALCAGTYTACISDHNGCSVCENVTVTFSNGIQETTDDSKLDLYPNPASDQVTLVFSTQSSGTALITITNILGENVYSEKIPVSRILTKSIDLSSYSSGIYFVSIQTAQKIRSKKLVKH
jgi:hypothetical protein